MGEKKDGDLFVWHIGGVDGAMNVVTWLVPIYLPGCDLDILARAAITEFDGQGILQKNRTREVRVWRSSLVNLTGDEAWTL